MIADSLIIGSGVIGLSLAWELVQRGQQVIVLESGEFAKGASWAGAGILPPTAKNYSPDTYEQLRSLGHQLHPEWSDRLKTRTGIDNEYQRCGGIYLARSAVESATLVGNQVWWQEHDIEFQKLTPAALSETEGSLREISDQIKSAWLLPDELKEE